MKNKKGALGIGGIVLLFIGIVFGLALLTPIADTVGGMTNKQVASNVTTSIVSAFGGDNNVSEEVNFTLYTQSAWKQVDCPLSSVVIRNGAGTVLTDATDYTIDRATGIYTLGNTSNTVPATSLNITYADYTYCLDGYNKDSGSRSMLTLILVFTAMILLGFVLEKSGVIDLGRAFGG